MSNISDLFSNIQSASPRWLRYCSAQKGQFSVINEAKSVGQILLVDGLAAASACARRIPLMDELQ
jgi:hypothetical protein